MVAQRVRDRHHRLDGLKGHEHVHHFVGGVSRIFDTGHFDKKNWTGKYGKAKSNKVCFDVTLPKLHCSSNRFLKEFGTGSEKDRKSFLYIFLTPDAERWAWSKGRAARSRGRYCVGRNIMRSSYSYADTL